MKTFIGKTNLVLFLKSNSSVPKDIPFFLSDIPKYLKRSYVSNNQQQRRLLNQYLCDDSYMALW